MNKKSVLSKKEKEVLLGQFAPKEEIEVDTAISWDGASLLVRIPKDIADYFGINKKNRKKKRMKFFVKEEKGEIIKKFDIINKNEKKKSSK